jgi:hypothetical protein
MSVWRDQIAEALADFASVIKLARSSISYEAMVVEYLDAPHKVPTLLPAGKMAIYAFWWNDEWLKVGKAGPQSEARYTSQHYNPASAPSTLAASLLRDKDFHPPTAFNRDQPGSWIKAHCCRVNILMPSKNEVSTLSLLEAFLHVRLNPRYEGSKSKVV